MTSVKWLIEQYDFVENIDDLIRTIKELGDAVHIVQYRPFSEVETVPFGESDCVVAIGTIGFIDRIQRTQPWVPGTYATFRNYECTSYYPAFGQYLFNSDYVMLPLGEIRRRFNWLQKTLGAKSLFVRPNSGKKCFGGSVLLDTRDIDLLDRANPNTLCVVSAKKSMGCEFRYFVADKTILDGAMYYNCCGTHEPKNISALTDTSDKYQETLCREMVTKILTNIDYAPDRVFCIDMVFDLAKGPKVMEISAFSTSGWYGASPSKIIPYVRELAIAEWKEYND